MKSSVLNLNWARWALSLSLFLVPALSEARLEVQNKGGIAYVSGGVGKEERQAISQLSNQFNLKLTLAVKTGQFLGDVPVRILDAGGNTVLETIANGPLLFAQLPPGKYTVIGNVDGQERKGVAQVASHRQAQLMLTWPAGTNGN